MVVCYGAACHFGDLQTYKLRARQPAHQKQKQHPKGKKKKGNTERLLFFEAATAEEAAVAQGTLEAFSLRSFGPAFGKARVERDQTIDNKHGLRERK